MSKEGMLTWRSTTQAKRASPEMKHAFASFPLPVSLSHSLTNTASTVTGWRPQEVNDPRARRPEDSRVQGVTRLLLLYETCPRGPWDQEEQARLRREQSNPSRKTEGAKKRMCACLMRKRLFSQRPLPLPLPLRNFNPSTG